VSGLERSRRGFRQERREEHEVLEADDGRLALAGQARDVRAGEASAETQHPSMGVALA
jgi:hypothetical protein